jgi:5-methylcytosine-specific restriction enzyme A
MGKIHMARIELHDRKPLTTKQRVQLFFDRKGECCICKGKIDAASSWIDEHIRPLAMGGSNDWENRGCAHVGCAKDKTKKDMGDIAKAKRLEANHIGATVKQPSFQSRPFQSRLKPEKGAGFSPSHKKHLEAMAAKAGR